MQGKKATFLGSPIQNIPAQDGVFEIEMFEPAGQVFNQPMVVLKHTTFGWVPLNTIKLLPS